MRAFALTMYLLVAMLCAAEEQPQPTPNATPPAPASEPAAKDQGTKDNPAALDPVNVSAPAERAQAIQQGRTADLTRLATSASEGIIGAKQLEDRPISRPAEVLETVPGLIATQHSGEGKANQYFFRGFNLDHGTDFATWLDGMPINMRTHGHGQGYTDLNFLIPELVGSVEYKKGPIYASEGDFSATGAAHISYAKKLEHNTAEIMAGTFNHQRALAMYGKPVASGNVIAALDLERNDGPWEHPQAVQRVSGVLGYSRGTAEEGWSVTGMGYHNQWNSTDQIPLRAVAAGLDRLDAIDPSDGGRTQRYSLSAEYHRVDENSSTTFSAYAIAYSLKLWNNFTFFLDDPVDGDQFEQTDRRIVGGFNFQHTFFSSFCGHRVENTLGFQNRNDFIDVRLLRTKDRSILGTTRKDKVFESNFSPYVENNVQWTDKIRTVTGVRYDIYKFDVESDNPANNGNKWASIVNPKGSLILGPWAKTEFYLNYGLGFHSNDARGVATTIDPKSGDATKKAPPLVRAKGQEFGIRTTYIPHLNTTLSAFLLDLDSELVFVGDAGTTEAGRASRRVGLEFANYYQPLDWLTFDFDLSLSRARFRDADPSGRYIPGSLESVLATGVSIDHCSGWFGGVRLRFFGARPLIEDNSVRSSSTTLLSARVGYKFNDCWKLTLEGFNLLNRKDHDIDYFYGSRLKNEPPTSVDDLHFHPVEPIQARLSLTFTW